MARLTSCLDLPNRDLLEETRRLAANERSSSAVLIAALAEVDGRRLYLAEGYSCMFHYCTDSLHLSESAAYKRIEVARVSRAFPQILEALERGALNVSSACVIAPHLTTRNVNDLIEAASFKKKKEVERLVAALHPKSDVPTVVRKQPTSQGSDVSAEENLRGSLLTAAEPTSGGSAATAVAAATTGGDVSTIISRALSLLIADVERKKLGLVRRPRPSKEDLDATPKAPSTLIARPGIATPAHDSDSRHIPAAVKRAVVARDGGRCAFVGRDGRCGERGFLEFHHVVPYAAGGKATVDNIALRCKAHNGHEAVLYFGEAALPRRARADSG